MIRLASFLAGLLWCSIAAAAPPALDVNANSLKTAVGSGTTVACTGLSTTSTDDVIIVITNNTTYDASIKSVTGVAGASLTFVNAGTVQRVLSGVWGSKTEIWYAQSAAALTTQTFTATFSASTPELAIACFAISGTDTTNPLDGNASLAGTVNTGASSAQITVTGVSTTRNNDFIVTVCSTISVSCGGAASGYTALTSAIHVSDSDFRTYYKTITSALSSASVDIDGGPANGGNKGIVQAFTADSATSPGAAGTIHQVPWMMGH